MQTDDVRRETNTHIHYRDVSDLSMPRTSPTLGTMTKKMLLLAAPLLVTLALTGCAQPQSTVSDNERPTQAATAAPRPTAAAPTVERCFDSFSLEQEHRDGPVTWPSELSDSQIPVQPSCWAYTGASDSEYAFAARWYGLDDDEETALNSSVEEQLASAGYQITTDSDGVTESKLETPEKHYGQATITREAAYYEVEISTSNY
jgi:hypothetical protein